MSLTDNAGLTTVASNIDNFTGRGMIDVSP